MNNHSLKRNIAYALLLTCCLGLLAACEPRHQAGPPMNTFETASVEQQLREFKNSPTETNMKNVEVSLIKMEGEIKELEQKVTVMEGADRAEAQNKLERLRSQYTSYQQEFTEAKVKSSLNKAADTVERAVTPNN
jgi:TolA-binding protein